MNSFNQHELQRYSRHFSIPEIGIAGQQKLKKASVLVVGAGGLGCPLLLYLTAAGIGTIGVADFDTVDVTNLHRQVLYTGYDVGKPKAETACHHLKACNGLVNLIPISKRLTSHNALEIISAYDIVADCTDNFPSRYLINDACVMAGKPLAFASVYRFEGQLTLLNARLENGTRGPNYRDLFPQPPLANAVPNCAESGILGVLPGIMGSLQANEIIKCILGLGENLSGRWLLFNALSLEVKTLKFNKREDNPLTGKAHAILRLQDLPLACNNINENNMEVKEIDVHELKRMMDNNQDFQLIDVREVHEHNLVNIGGELVPLSTIADKKDSISAQKPVVVYCRSGARSANAIAWLQKSAGFINLYNLKGGILAWANEIDTGMVKY